MMTESIDIFCHCLPPEYCRAALEKAVRPLHMLNRAQAIPVAVDVGARLVLMDGFPGYRQVLSLASPPLEIIAGPDATPDLARLANDAMAAMVAEHPARFPGFVASVAMNNMEPALVEAERAITTLGACGVQIFTNINGRPLDEPEFSPLFDLMAQLDRPMWLHPARGMNVPDYATEKVSRFELWWALGWPYETSVAMARLVFAGIFEKWPHLKIITHHMGGMIPMMEGRLSPGLDALGTRTPPEYSEAVSTPLAEHPLDAFRRFYADTASFGSRAAIECGLAFFGLEKMLFASDMPFGPEGGLGHIRDTLRAINEMELSSAEREQILSGNARRLLRS
ncbi:MAG TPA: amidohydrolase family protein [Abditibacteriaceae bacterium]|nr:amidohydrolase family protein [Abditibacteriaceae bacterium]